MMCCRADMEPPGSTIRRSASLVPDPALAYMRFASFAFLLRHPGPEAWSSLQETFTTNEAMRCGVAVSGASKTSDPVAW